MFLPGLDAAGLDALAETALSLPQAVPGAALDGATRDCAAQDYLDAVVLERALEVLLAMDSGGTPIRATGAHCIARRARDLVEGCPDEPLTLTGWCEALHFSRGPLLRAFLEVYGIFPLAFLRLRRPWPGGAFICPGSPWITRASLASGSR